jgi:hypothetical protein
MAIIEEKSVREAKVENGKWEMGFKKVHDHAKLIYISNVGKGCWASGSLMGRSWP